MKPKPECYLCEKEGTTRDHLPPQGFFTDPKPANLITVPCCYAHNQSFQKLDEKLRIHFSATGSSPDARKLWMKVLASLKRPESQGLTASFFKGLRHNSKGELGTDYPPETDRWIIRLIRGLYYFHTKRKLGPETYFFTPYFNPSGEEVLKLVGQFKGVKSKKVAGVVWYMYGISEEDHDTSVWAFFFFGNTIFLTASLGKLTFDQKKKAEAVRPLMQPSFDL